MTIDRTDRPSKYQDAMAGSEMHQTESPREFAWHCYSNPVSGRHVLLPLDPYCVHCGARWNSVKLTWSPKLDCNCGDVGPVQCDMHGPRE